MNKNIVIITELPFRKQGNQSLMRFTNMFLNNDYSISLFTSGNDDLGVVVVEHERFNLKEMPKVQKLYSGLSSFFRNLIGIDLRDQPSNENNKVNHFITMKSDDVIPPFGAHDKQVMIKKWAAFLISYLDNLFCACYLIIKYSNEIRAADVIVGYESGKAIAAKMIARLFGKKYINKYQGTVLKAVDRNLKDAKLYYPHIYYGINKSDLCLMVNDGTDGEFYARQRGCDNVVFEPHGVGVEEYLVNNEPPQLIRDNPEKFILFNNASRSRWKRVDRVIRALALFPRENLEKILLLTTYHADDKDLLVEYTKQLGLEKNVKFIAGLNHIESNAYIQFSNVVIMTNEMSNLGNPVLEALYYGTPVLSLNDGSLDGFVNDGVDSVLIDVDGNMDQQMSCALIKLCNDVNYYNSLEVSTSQNTSVSAVKNQQERELQKIEQTIYN
jgi:L-malate glycosyltransferase